MTKAELVDRLAVTLQLPKHQTATVVELFLQTIRVWSWSGLSSACPGAARRRGHTCRCGTGCQPTDAGTCQ
jgi:hypothetical protein